MLLPGSCWQPFQLCTPSCGQLSLDDVRCDNEPRHMVSTCDPSEGSSTYLFPSAASRGAGLHFYHRAPFTLGCFVLTRCRAISCTPSSTRSFSVPPLSSSISSSCLPVMCPAAGSVRCYLLYYLYLPLPSILFHMMLPLVRASLTVKDKRWFLFVIEGQLSVWILKRTRRRPFDGFHIINEDQCRACREREREFLRLTEIHFDSHFDQL